MSKTTTEKATYCVLSSGYTGRLVSKLGYKKTLIEENMYKIKINKKSDNYNDLIDDIDDDDITERFYDQILFISDKLWGKGTYYTNKKNAAKIINILDSEKMKLSGTICLKCENFLTINYYIQLLKNVYFCACYGEICDITIIEKDGEKIIYCVIDAESG